MFKFIFLLLLLWASTLLWPAFFQKLSYGLINRLCGLKRRQINDGVILWPYLERNPAGKEVVLLLHGIYASKDLWSTYINTLSKLIKRQGKENYRYLSVDLPGFGEQSRDPGVPIDIDSQVDHLINFLNAMQIDRVHIIGNSMGGLIACKFAIKHSKRLLSLTNINGAGTLSDVPSEAEKLIKQDKNPFEISSIENFDKLARLCAYKQTYFPRFLKQAIINNYVNNRAYYDPNMKTMVEYIYSKPLNPELQHINVPTLVLWGLHDKIFDVSCCGHLEQSIPNCKVVILHNSAHVPFVEQPRLTAKYNIEFLQGIEIS